MTQKPSPAMMPKTQKAIDKKNKRPFVVHPHMQARHLKDNPLLLALKDEMDKPKGKAKGKRKRS